jgi:hypothetical protein
MAPGNARERYLGITFRGAHCRRGFRRVCIACSGGPCTDITGSGAALTSDLQRWNTALAHSACSIVESSGCSLSRIKVEAACALATFLLPPLLVVSSPPTPLPLTRDDTYLSHSVLLCSSSLVCLPHVYYTYSRLLHARLALLLLLPPRLLSRFIYAAILPLHFFLSLHFRCHLALLLVLDVAINSLPTCALACSLPCQFLPFASFVPTGHCGPLRAFSRVQILDLPYCSVLLSPPHYVC